jgi:glutamate 5-kinase
LPTVNLRTPVAAAKRVVIKIGTAVLTDSAGRFDRSHFAALTHALTEVAQDRELIIVTSGAIALGVERLGLKSRPKAIPAKQAAAACGQSRLMQAYDQAFAEKGRAVAQVLLTHDDVASRKRYLNARRALDELLAHRVVPVINENDTVSVDELKFGDNDALAGVVAGLVEAELLLILSDVPGLFDADPRGNPAAKLLVEVDKVTAELERAAGGSVSGVGTGGMATKVRAAKRAGEVGTQVIIASGKDAQNITRAVAGEEVGTWFKSQLERLPGRKRWLAHATKPKGELRVDQGAVDAIAKKGKSLLPSGIRAVHGSFGLGEPVDISGPDGKPFARGISGYAADELRKLAGHKSAEIEQVLGYRYLDEAVHRDDLVLL